MALTKKQQVLREGKVTASFAPALMAGNKERIMSEWRMLVGDPTWKPVYVGGKPMRIGSHSIGTSTWNSAEREQQRRKQDRAAAGMGASALNRPF